MTPLEVACGVPFGGTSIRLPHSDLHPARALEDATVPALEGPGRALVAYSGGRDSSLVLAAATAAARRHGLPEPVPVTIRVPDVPAAKEDDWQERTVRHLGLRDWERVTVTDELDLLGAAAQDILVRHGPFWPANAHFIGLLLRRAAGGALMTGEGGDDLFAWWRWRRAADLLAGRARRRPRDLLTVAAALAPPAPRRRIARRRVGDRARLPWLTPRAQAMYASRLAGSAEVPRRWDRQLAWMSGRRSMTVAAETLAVLAEDAGARVLSPLLAPGFLGALATHGGRHGMGDRTATLRRLFSGLLPEAVLARPDKATFGPVFFGPATRRFAADWDGSGVDPALVDAGALRRTWLAERVHWQSSDLIHRCWLHGRL
jgi:asparagine synthetase B (glutamine-hydrolysing)